MSCAVCRGLRQFLVNVLELADKALNTATLGNPNENMSRRIARAREAGERWAAAACRVLTVIFWPFRHGDHCTWSLQPGSEAAEIWHWSPPAAQPLVNPDEPA